MLKNIRLSSVTWLITFSPFSSLRAADGSASRSGQRCAGCTVTGWQPEPEPNRVAERAHPQASTGTGHHINHHWRSVLVPQTECGSYRKKIPQCLMLPGWPGVHQNATAARREPRRYSSQSVVVVNGAFLCLKKPVVGFSQLLVVGMLWLLAKNKFHRKSCKNFNWLCARAGGVVMGSKKKRFQKLIFRESKITRWLIVSAGSTVCFEVTFLRSFQRSSQTSSSLWTKLDWSTK